MRINFRRALRCFVVVTAAVVMLSCSYDDTLSIPHGMLKLLWREKYEELDASLDEQFALFKRGKLRGRVFMYRLWMLQAANPQIYVRFETWRASRPESRWAELVSGLNLMQRAWYARGEKEYGETPAENILRMEELATQAQIFLNAAKDKGMSPALYAGGLINTHMLLGIREGNRELLDDALHAEPTIWRAAEAYYWSLFPQWGGSEEQMQAFSSEMKRRDERLGRYLESILHWRRGLERATNGDVGSATLFYKEALKHYPYEHALKNLGEIYIGQGRCREAVETLQIELDENDPWDAWTLILLERAHRCAGNPLRAYSTRSKLETLEMRFRQGI